MPRRLQRDPAAATAGPGRLGTPTRITSAGQVEDLAAWLLSPHRDDRWGVVVTVPSQRQHPFIDPEAVAAAHADSAEVYLVGELAAAQQLSGLLPDGAAVFGGAVRLYPPGESWAKRPREASPVLVCRSVADAPLTIERIGRALADAAEATSGSRRTARSATASPTTESGRRLLFTHEDGVSLARYLVAADRAHPVVAITVHPDAQQPFLDVGAISGDLQDLCEVVVLSATAAFGLTDGLGDKTLSVFYGAGRVYPVGTGWLRDKYAAPLHMCPTPGAAARVTPRLLDDALKAANAAGLLVAQQPAPNARPVTVTVGSVLNDHQVMVTSGRDAAVMLADRLIPGIPAQRLLTSGQRLAGTWQQVGALGEFRPAAVADDPATRVDQAYPDGSIVLARVADVSAEHARALLHPHVPAILDRSGDDPPLTHLLSPGDVVAILAARQTDGWHAVLVDITETHPSPAIPVLPEGPPWLIPEDLVPPDPGTDDISHEEPGEHEPLQASVDGRAAAGDERLATAEAMISQLTGQVQDLQTRLNRRDRQVARLRAELRSATSRAKSARAGSPVVFDDPVEQFRHEVGLAWLARVPDAARAHHPLPAQYDIGEGFLPSLDALEGVHRGKVVDVVVEVLTGLARENPSRAIRHWQTSKTGPQQVRRDQARAWRVNLQQNTPGARRLKYWVHTDGTVELDSVGHHDDGLT